MKFCFLGALVLAWMIVTPPSATMKFRVEQCCFPTRAACEAALKKMKKAAGTCEVEKTYGALEGLAHHLIGATVAIGLSRANLSRVGADLDAARFSVSPLSRSSFAREGGRRASCDGCAREA